MKTRINNIKKAISKDLVERDEIINISILAMLSGVSIFYYGVPGTAKSLLARRLSKIYKDNEFFDYLMNKFSTPEEVFGPLSLKALKEDRIERKTKGYLPNADVAFLDEIWKSSPAILNTLLTIINEKTFKNNGVNEKVPLKTLIAASNELPAPNQGLEALYDRLIVRLVVPRVKDDENFKSLLKLSNVESDIEVEEAFNKQELKEISQKSSEIFISDEVLNLILAIKNQIALYNQNQDEKDQIDISERRFVNAMKVLRTSAHLSGRKELSLVDILLLKHCLWDKAEQISTIDEIIKNSIKDYSIKVQYETTRLAKLSEVIQALPDKTPKRYAYPDSHQFSTGSIYFGNKPKVNFYGLAIDIRTVNPNLRKKNSQEICKPYSSYSSYYVYCTCDALNSGEWYPCYFSCYIYDSNCYNISDNPWVCNEPLVYKLDLANSEIIFAYRNAYFRDYGLNAEYHEYKPQEFDPQECKRIKINIVPVEDDTPSEQKISTKQKEMFLKELKDIKSKLENEKKSCDKTMKDFKIQNENVFLKDSDYEVFFTHLQDAKSNISTTILEATKLHDRLSQIEPCND